MAPPRDRDVRAFLGTPRLRDADFSGQRWPGSSVSLESFLSDWKPQNRLHSLRRDSCEGPQVSSGHSRMRQLFADSASSWPVRADGAPLPVHCFCSHQGKGFLVTQQRFFQQPPLKQVGRQLPAPSLLSLPLRQPLSPPLSIYPSCWI